MTIHDRSEHIEFSMTFDAPVTVTGDPTFAFDLGGAWRDDGDLLRGLGHHQRCGSPTP